MLVILLTWLVTTSFLLNRTRIYIFIFKNVWHRCDLKMRSKSFNHCHACRAFTRKTIETIKAFLTPSHEHVKGFLSKWTALKVRFVVGPSNCCLQACRCAVFSPEILQAGAVKGLKRYEKGKAQWVLYYHHAKFGNYHMSGVRDRHNVSLLVPAGLTLIIIGYTDPLYMWVQSHSQRMVALVWEVV